MELYIENQKVDLAPDQVFAVTVQSNDITKPDTVQSSYSNSLTLPYTERNHRVLGNATEVSSQSGVPYSKLTAAVLQDGLEVVPLPKAFLREAGEGYEVDVFSGAVDFFALLGDKSIRDLDLSDLTHTWDVAGVASGTNFGRGWQDGYIYTYVDRGKPLHRGTLYAGDLYPSVFARLVLDRIFAEAGIAYTLEEQLLDQLMLPFSNDKPVHNQAWIDALTTEQDISDPATLVTIPRYHGVINLLAEVNVTMLTEAQESKLAFRIMLDGVEMERTEQLVTSTGPAKLEAKFELSPWLDLTRVSVNFQTINLSPASNPTPSTSQYDSMRLTTHPSEDAFFGTEWDVAANLPDISQKDFFKSIRSLFDLVPSFDPYSNTMRLTHFQELEANKASALDWSSKLVQVGDGRVPVQYRFGEFGRQSWFRYKADENGGSGDAFLTVEDAQLEEAKDVVTLPFAASVDAAQTVSIPMYKQPEALVPTDFTHKAWDIADRDQAMSGYDDGNKVYVLDASADPAVREGWAVYEKISGKWWLRQTLTYDRQKVEPRLTVLNGDTGVLLGATLFDDFGNYYNVSLCRESFAPIGFATLLPAYHVVLQSVLTRCKGITPHFLLSAADVAGYDASIPIWLDQYQHYFYLNSINEFTGEGPTECQLWRL